MRMLVRVRVPTSAGNDAIVEGRMADVLERALKQLNPEFAYFTTLDGERAFYLGVDVADVSRMPVIAEPLYLSLNARVDWFPAMNIDELRTGLKAAAEAMS